MPLWSVEEWRARIGSSWAALGRQALHCSSHYSCSKQRRHYVQCCPALGGGGGGGGGLVATILPMMTTITLLVRSMSLIIVHPLEPGSSTNFHCEWDKNTQILFHQSTSVEPLYINGHPRNVGICLYKSDTRHHVHGPSYIKKCTK